MNVLCLDSSSALMQQPVTSQRSDLILHEKRSRQERKLHDNGTLNYITTSLKVLYEQYSQLCNTLSAAIKTDNRSLTWLPNFNDTQN